MPARITVNVELESLLAKSQGLTVANWRAKVKREDEERENRNRLFIKKAKENAARRKPTEEPVGRNIFTAAMGQQGYPFAYGFKAYIVVPEWPGTIQGATLWSGDGVATVSSDLLQINGSLQVTVPTGAETSITTNTQSLRVLDEIFLPVNGSTFIYCLFSNRLLGSSVWTQTTIVDGTFVDNGGTVTEETFCAFVGKTAARVIAMPAGVSDAMRDRIGEIPWLPGDRLTSNGGLSYFPRYGRFQTETAGNFGQLAISTSRFEGMGFSAGIYQAMGLPAVTPPAFALFDYDLTRNPDDPVPVYRPNPYYLREANQVVVTPPRTFGELNRAWDWGRAGYCRDQLLALGFAEADLTP